ncbi:MAG: hypothetical protein A2015_16535 [Spirochaetes bacterium GWF1_31_7]|nr:MAG: hypothetical protein A2Y30_13900 [Spirochaetes bacterium GWE1_32_154]OHD50052.1 MAG: hypothetical protein A2Y29_11945 [Spirochaetes bacterium GWE2_31_10]OHD52366.1 MAG: hypothetical protein A2015_16535 [Spirochaetes bacterium GWF1_31_7]OHD81682.1 MAG: hypothetical protein A2355_07385 [Spirochaetes bacterium RIFOXYB1_FULL_32_8]HBD96006.1 hypothetical protein [Spirochaetia bacterium]
MSHISKWDKTPEFFEQIKAMIVHSKMNEDIHITPDNVYQEAYKPNRDTLFNIIKMGHLEGSTLLGTDNLKKLNQLAKEGKSCLILSEHLSNMDVPSMFVRFYDQPDNEMKEIFEKLIFIAGAKLNQTPLVKLFTEMFTRVVIYAIRSLVKISGDDSKKDEMDLAKKINMRATRKILELKHKNHIFVMYPTGTRYREWDPDSKKGMKETMAYLNSFDYLCCCSINGNIMRPKEHEDMTRETFTQDLLVFNFGEVFESKSFIESINQQNNSITDKDELRQIQVDEIMNKIENLHNNAEKYRKPILEKLGYDG